MERTYTVQDLLAALRRRRRLALAVTAAVLAVSAAIIMALPSEYSAESMTQVEPHRLAPDFFPGNAVVSFEDRMRTLRHGLLARPVLERVIKDTQFFDDAEQDMDRAVERMRRQIEVRLEGEVASGPPALLFVVQVKGRDREKVARAAELLPRYYAEMTRDLMKNQARNLRQTLDTQVGEMSKQLAAEEKKLLAFKSEHATETPEAAEANMRAATRIAGQMDLRLTAIADAQRRRTAVMAMIPELESDAGRASVAVEEAQRRLETARATYGNDNPDVRRAERALADARTRAEEQSERREAGGADDDHQRADEQSDRVGPPPEGESDGADDDRLQGHHDQHRHRLADDDAPARNRRGAQSFQGSVPTVEADGDGLAGERCRHHGDREDRGNEERGPLGRAVAERRVDRQQAQTDEQGDRDEHREQQLLTVAQQELELERRLCGDHRR